MDRPSHIFTVDVEDWPQSTLDRTLNIGPRVLGSTQAVLDLMEESGAKGTFFILGKAAEAYPELAPRIAEAGHEIATHGYSHNPVDKMSLGTFREELRRSIDTLRQQTGRPVLGHRAADFSISSRSLYLLECLAEEGITYDSSIFPIRHRRYGIPGTPRVPYRVVCSSGQCLVEFPIATVLLAGATLPAAGGGYLRCFPYGWSRLALTGMEKMGASATCYIHPYELDVKEHCEIEHHVPLPLRLSQFFNRRTVKAKLRRLFAEFRFVTMAEACDSLGAGLTTGLEVPPYPHSRPIVNLPAIARTFEK